jgi:putative intracellular protease/amidase
MRWRGSSGDPEVQRVLANYPGDHGRMWDLADDPTSIALIEAFYNAGKPVAAVCHAPVVLHTVTYQGQPIVKGKRDTGFTNGEEKAVHFLSSSKTNCGVWAASTRRPPTGRVSPSSTGG